MLLNCLITKYRAKQIRPNTCNESSVFGMYKFLSGVSADVCGEVLSLWAVTELLPLVVQGGRWRAPSTLSMKCTISPGSVCIRVSQRRKGKKRQSVLIKDWIFCTLLMKTQEVSYSAVDLNGWEKRWVTGAGLRRRRSSSEGGSGVILITEGALWPLALHLSYHPFCLECGWALFVPEWTFFFFFKPTLSGKTVT